VKGGGDPAAAARAVLQTGEYDYAWNLQVEPEVLDSLVSDDSPGEVVVERGTAVERLNFQFADPWTEVGGQRAEMNTPHPILTDKAVRQAISFAIPRDLIAERFYGEGQPATPNILTGLESFDSPNTSWEYDLEKASRILDDAGWIMEGNVRKKDDLELRLVLATSVNSVRQKTQAVIKEELSKIGIEVQLEQVDAAIYFDSAAGNDQNIGHFYWDMNMWATNAQSVIPIGYMNAWYAGADRQNIAQKSNEWSGNNQARWVNEEYDATYDSIFTVTSMEEALELLIRLNDIVIEDVAVLPLVNRSADTYGISRTLVKENVALGAGMERNYWNIANWNRKAE
ncbi:MAG TPA: ABC transporter substrate-binding protein, partial [Thermomicrobiales bacterium]|nr:ABC transporter substrate-binding protein [Thermomicrobiales bacterium]